MIYIRSYQIQNILSLAVEPEKGVQEQKYESDYHSHKQIQ